MVEDLDCVLPGLELQPVDVDDKVLEQIGIVGFLSQLCDQLRGKFYDRGYRQNRCDLHARIRGWNTYRH